jgi:retron-type reverse transcriptase
MTSLIRRICLDLVLHPSTVLRILQNAQYRYKVYQIPKRNGGKRTIAQPTPELKALQRWVVQNILDKCPIHPAAKAYRSKTSILSNAEPHKANRFLLKLDFENFFPSILASDFRHYVETHPNVCPMEDLENLEKILFFRRRSDPIARLSIGAPSSPALSNILLFEFDQLVGSHCDSRNIVYTRYADDLVFSCGEINVLGNAEKKVREICQELKSPRLTINEDKTVRASMKSSRRITGLVVANDGSVSIGHQKKRLVRVLFHRLATEQATREQVEYLRGYIAFVKSVDPVFFAHLLHRYADEVKKLGKSRSADA